MRFILFFFIVLFPFYSTTLSGQSEVDFERSVPLYIEYENNQGTLKWLNDGDANLYQISSVSYNPSISVGFLGNTPGEINEFDLGDVEPGMIQEYLVTKNSNGSTFTATGLISTGVEVFPVHERGRCLIAIDDTLAMPLTVEIARLMNDIVMDGWEVDTLHISRSLSVPEVKTKIENWYQGNYTLSQTVFILGHVPVPYSGNTSYDGHANHQGAWVADSYYADMDGSWTDTSVNNTSPTRPANKNIPGDGKFDQSGLPSKLELEIGRVDFHDITEFGIGEVELTQMYLNKDHLFRTGQRKLPRRAIVENNFSTFAEGFGQSAWKNFVPMFGIEHVESGDYLNVLKDEEYLCSYACGPGSYQSMGGVGNTANVWVANDMKTVFTYNFGSYMGDWDVSNNFLRSALASGDVLTNAWAGRPVWFNYQMALGTHIGFCTRYTQNASDGLYQSGFGGHSAHVSLLGDPTLRLHPMLPVMDLELTDNDGDVQLKWEESMDAETGYFIYRKLDDGPWEVLAEFHNETEYLDLCLAPDSEVDYMIKASKLEHSASGSYYNLSQGLLRSISVGSNSDYVEYFVDEDNDGFGSEESIFACALELGYVLNSDDCDDLNPEINPDAIEIANNGIDEDCDGMDLLSSDNDLSLSSLKIFPNPVKDQIYLTGGNQLDLNYSIVTQLGEVVQEGSCVDRINSSQLRSGIYFLKLLDRNGQMHSEVLVKND